MDRKEWSTVLIGMAALMIPVSLIFVGIGYGDIKQGQTSLQSAADNRDEAEYNRAMANGTSDDLMRASYNMTAKFSDNFAKSYEKRGLELQSTGYATLTIGIPLAVISIIMMFIGVGLRLML